MTKDCERGSNDLETQGLNQWAIDFMVTSFLGPFRGAKRNLLENIFVVEN